MVDKAISCDYVEFRTPRQLGRRQIGANGPCPDTVMGSFGGCKGGSLGVSGPRFLVI